MPTNISVTKSGAFIPSGNISATTIQAAIQEAAAEALQKSANLADLLDFTAARSNLEAESVGSALLAIATHEATVEHPLASPATRGMMAAADKLKLDGVAPNATANATDEQLRDRANHTGEQAISTVLNLQTILDGKAPVMAAGKRVFDQQAEPEPKTRGDIWRERDDNGDLVQEWFRHEFHWLSTQTFVKEATFFNIGLAAFVYELPISYNVFLLNFKANFILGNTHNATNYWSFVLQRFGPTTATLSTILSNAASANTWFTIAKTLNLHLDVGGTGSKALRLSNNRDVGTPSNLTGSLAVSYRLARI